MTTSLDQVVRVAVDSGQVPHLAVTVADRSGPVYQGAAGPRVVGGPDPITLDDVFRIASMTKILTTVAALQFVERGLLDLDAPVHRYLPVFDDLQVLVGFDGDVPALRPPTRRATVRQLLTHTAGLSYWFCNADLARWEAITGNPNIVSGHEGTFRAPLVADPGSRFEYGINSDWLGRVLEVVAGQGLDAVFAEGITDPLRMTDTCFAPDDKGRARQVPTHLRRRDGDGWVATGLDWNPVPDWWSGGQGLYSTPLDYLTLQRALLGGGEVDGVRILPETCVTAMFTDQLGGLPFPSTMVSADPRTSADVDFGPDLTWGFGLLLNTRRRPGLRHEGSGGWFGGFNTFFWVDPRAGLTAGVYTQTLPLADPAVWSVYQAVERAIYAER
jgi:CubicO group peptidase (beta-lactamase class C family)